MIRMLEYLSTRLLKGLFKHTEGERQPRVSNIWYFTPSFRIVKLSKEGLQKILQSIGLEK